MAYLIARYVDPQTMYMEANAAMICPREAWVRPSFNEGRSRGESANSGRVADKSNQPGLSRYFVISRTICSVAFVSYSSAASLIRAWLPSPHGSLESKQSRSGQP